MSKNLSQSVEVEHWIFDVKELLLPFLCDDRNIVMCFKKRPNRNIYWNTCLRWNYTLSRVWIDA